MSDSVISGRKKQHISQKYLRTVDATSNSKYSLFCFEDCEYMHVYMYVLYSRHDIYTIKNSIATKTTSENETWEGLPDSGNPPTTK